MAISPGVTSKIYQISSYVQQVPSSIGFICALTEKGRDNELVYLADRSDLVPEFGEPSMNYGKNYSQGLYCAYNFLGESAIYFIRCLPTDAAYANILLNWAETDTTATISVSYEDTVNTTDDIETAVDAASAICMLYPIGRGKYYNSISVRLTAYSNPMYYGVYVLDIYEKQSDGDEVIIESFDVSFNAEQKDLSGESLFIVDILETYSSILRADMTISSGSYSDGYDAIGKFYDNEVGTVSANIVDGSAYIRDTKQDFSDWGTDSTTSCDYTVVALDGQGNRIWGWLGNYYNDNDSVKVYTDNIQTTQGWNGNTDDFKTDTTITYFIIKYYSDMSQPFSSDAQPLKKGSDGELLNANGSLNTDNATQVLSQGYSGTLDDNVLDTENIYFNLVLDCGYPSDVKTSISTMVQTRSDCVALMDNGDNSTYSTALTARNNTNVFNTYHVALYEPYTKVYDQFTGQNIWVSPIYHLSYLAPRNDRLSELWYAIAGFDRSSIDTIKEMRYLPNLSVRDQFYLKQLNPIAKFSPGYVLWGQLTTQAKPGPMQDLNISRLVLYIDRALRNYARFFIFTQNDRITWDQVSGEIAIFLEDIKTKRGLDSYSLEVSATDYERKMKKFHINVTLEPTRVVEKIDLNYFVR